MKPRQPRQYLADAKRTRAVAAAATIGVTGLVANPVASARPASADATPVMSNLPAATTSSSRQASGSAMVETPIDGAPNDPAPPQAPTTTPAPTPTAAPTTAAPTSSSPAPNPGTTTPSSTPATTGPTTTGPITTVPVTTGSGTIIPTTGPGRPTDTAVAPTLPTTLVPSAIDPVSTEVGGATTTTVPGSTTVPQVLTVLVPPSPAALGIPVTKSLGDILRTIRILESNETYTLPKNRGGASGAYQYIDSTWNNYMGYPSAYLAPPEIQDQKAALDVTAILSTWGGDVSMVPVIWYFPKAAYDPTLMDLVPMPGAGNSLTVRDYQTRWLRTYSRVTGTEIVPTVAAPTHTASTAGEPPVLQRNWGPFLQIAYPLLGPSSVEPAVCEGTDPAAGAVAVSTANCAPGGAVVINGQFHQPVVAVADGIISSVSGRVAADPAAPTTAVSVANPAGLTLIDSDGRSYTYSGFNDGTDPNVPQFSPLVKVGGRVRAGQVLGYLGGNDNDRRVTPVGPIDPAVDPATADTVAPAAATGNPPQLRLQITSPSGQPIDAEGLTYAASVRQACDVAVGPWSAVDFSAESAGTVSAASESTDSGRLPTVVPVIGGSTNDNWFIAPNGALSAQGIAAMIVAPAGCSLVPTQLFGPGAEGSESPTTWTGDIDVSVKYVVNAVSEQARDESSGIAPKIRR